MRDPGSSPDNEICFIMKDFGLYIMLQLDLMTCVGGLVRILGSTRETWVQVPASELVFSNSILALYNARAAFDDRCYAAWDGFDEVVVDYAAWDGFDDKCWRITLLGDGFDERYWPDDR